MKAAANNTKSAAYPRRTRNEAQDFIFIGFMAESVCGLISGLGGMPRWQFPATVFGDAGNN
jgi:hypothetical protein